MPRSPTTRGRFASNRRRWLSGAVTLPTAIAAAPARAQTAVRLGHVSEPGSLFAASAEGFGRRANGRLGDKAKVAVDGSSQPGGDKEPRQKQKLGTVELEIPSP